MKLYNTPQERCRLAVELAKTVFEDEHLMQDIGSMLSSQGRDIVKDVVVKEGIVEEAIGDMSSDEEITLYDFIQRLKK